MKQVTLLSLLLIAAVSIFLIISFPVQYFSVAAIILGFGWNSLRSAPVYPPDYE